MFKNIIDRNTNYTLKDGDLSISWHDKEHNKLETEIIKIIIERKGWYRSTNGKDSGQGKYLPGYVILGILEENPEWIRTKVAAKKFGL